MLCAGFTWDATIHKMTKQQWDAMLAVHVTAPFRIIQARKYIQFGVLLRTKILIRQQLIMYVAVALVLLQTAVA